MVRRPPILTPYWHTLSPHDALPLYPKKVTKAEMEPILLETDQPSSLGSLWEPGNGRAFMFEDRRASRVGDIVVVQIVEQHKGSKKANRSEEHTSELQSLMRISYAVFCLKKKQMYILNNISSD